MLLPPKLLQIHRWLWTAATAAAPAQPYCQPQMHQQAHEAKPLHRKAKPRWLELLGQERGHLHFGQKCYQKLFRQQGTSEETEPKT